MPILEEIYRLPLEGRLISSCNYNNFYQTFPLLRGAIKEQFVGVDAHIDPMTGEKFFWRSHMRGFAKIYHLNIKLSEVKI